MKYVIIGNSAAAIGAVEGIRQVDKDGSVTIISDEPYHTYSRPLISYYLAQKVTEAQMVYRPKGFYEQNNVELLLGQRVKGVKVDEKVVLTEQGNIPYDKLLVATGGKPIIPPIPGLEKKGVHTFIKFDDVKAIKELAAKDKKAVVIGAGLIGMKAAEALVQLGVDTTVVELSDRILSSILDKRSADLFKGFLERKGIKFSLGNTVAEVHGEDTVTSVKLHDGSEIGCDILIVAIGVTPNLEVVSATGLASNRGILVDEKLQTSILDIYAAGDVSEGFDLIYGEKRVLPILPNAYLQGETAGRVMAGADTSFAGGFAFNSIAIFGLAVNTAGIVNPEGEGYELLVDENIGNYERAPECESDKYEGIGKCEGTGKYDGDTIDTEPYYRKIVLRNNKVVGFIMLKGIERSGILTDLIRSQTDVSQMKKDLLKRDFGFAHFNAEARKTKLTGGVASA